MGVKKCVEVEVDNLFDDNLVRAVDEEANNLFWLDHWLKWGPLCLRFKRLFELANNRFVSVEEMCDLC